MNYPRFAEPRLVEALEDTPVVLIQGPRQCGKTTLARMVGGKRGYAYWSFDDALTLQAATMDPVGFLDNLPGRVILDEVQRVPGLFTALKVAVDRNREPGRFLLTGSSNVLLLPKLADLPFSPARSPSPTSPKSTTATCPKRKSRTLSKNLLAKTLNQIG